MNEYLYSMLIGAILIVGISVNASGYSWKETSESLTLLQQDKIVWRFNYGKEQTKPYFDPVALPGHTSLTWVSPPDHPWHYGVWFSLKYINGVNYWEESRKTHKAAGTTSWNNVEIDRHPDGAATITMQLRYAPAGRKDVLSELRAIRISSPDADGQYCMDWEQTFTALQDVTLDRTPPPGNPHSKPWGGYGGLSVRFSKNFKQWEAVTSAGDKNMKAHGQKAVAADFSGVVDGVPCGIAILNHPANPSAAVEWFYVMSPKTPFAYFNPAFLFHKPLVITEGNTMILRYRMFIHPDSRDVDMLNKESVRYFKAGGL